MTAATEQRILDPLDQLVSTVSQLTVRVDQLTVEVSSQRQELATQGAELRVQEEHLTPVGSDIGELITEVRRWNGRIETYQKASDKLVSLAASLIGGACVAIIAGVVLAIVRGM
ncbi:MAG: hypothetical protein ACK421_04125 [Pseudanabaenaceae cyanobacterium]